MSHYDPDDPLFDPEDEVLDEEVPFGFHVDDQQWTEPGSIFDVIEELEL